MVGMDHAAMSGAAPVRPSASTSATATTSPLGAGLGAPDAATEKLLTLVGELVKDPRVQEQIQQDSALREAWAKPAVRQVVTQRPE